MQGLGFLSGSHKRKPTVWVGFLVSVGPPGIEPGLHAPHACVLPVYYGPMSERCGAQKSAFLCTLSERRGRVSKIQLE